MEQIERLFLHLLDVIEQGRAEKSLSFVAPPPQVGGDLLPSVAASGIYPSSGSTMLDVPTPLVVQWGNPSPPSHSTSAYIVGGFEVRKDGDVVIVGEGEYVDGKGNKHHGGGVTLPFKPHHLVVLDTQTGEVSLTQFRLPRHIVLAYLTEQEVQRVAWS